MHERGGLQLQQEPEYPIDLQQTVAQVHAGMLALAAMRARGRTAKDRVRRALDHAGRFRLSTPALAQALNS